MPAKKPVQDCARVFCRGRTVLATAAFFIVMSLGAPPAWMESTEASTVIHAQTQVVVSFDAFDPAEFTAAAFAD